jgi:hypothetical protein
MILYILLRGRLNEEKEHVFNKFPKYHMKILLENFNAKVGREDIFKQTIRNESLHEISNDNGIIVVNSATSINQTVESTMFPHHNFHKFTWTSTNKSKQNKRNKFHGFSPQANYTDRVTAACRQS